MILGYTSWGGAVRRGLVHPEDQLTLALLRSPRVRAPAGLQPVPLGPGEARARRPRPTRRRLPGSETRRLHEPLRLRRTRPDRRPRASSARAPAYERGVRRDGGALRARAAGRHHRASAVAGFGHFDWAGPVTYYAIDDLRGPRATRALVARLRRSFERHTRGTGAGSSAVTPASLGRVERPRAVRVIPNGIESDRVARAGPARRTGSPRCPAARCSTSGPSTRASTSSSVVALAEAYPDASIVLVGQCPRSRDHARSRELAPTSD